MEQHNGRTMEQQLEHERTIIDQMDKIMSNNNKWKNKWNKDGINNRKKDGKNNKGNGTTLGTTIGT